MLLTKECACKLGFDMILNSKFKTNDPVLTAILGKGALASQPILSRFFNWLNASSLRRFYDILHKLCKVAHAIKGSQMILLGLDSTLLDTYGHQEVEGFNFHYQNHGYHPLIYYNGRIGDLLKIKFFNRTNYSCTGVTDFLQPLLDQAFSSILKSHCCFVVIAAMQHYGFIGSEKQMALPMSST